MISKNNKIKITPEEEQKFISYFGKNIKIILKSGNIVEGYCETFTRAIDSDNNEPSLTIATTDGLYGVDYSEVESIEIL